MALDLGTLVARLRVDNDMDPGLDRGRRSMDRFVSDAGRRLDGLRDRFRQVGRGAGEGVGDGVDEGSRRGLGRFSDRIKAAGEVIGDMAKKGAAGVKDLAGSFVTLAKENPQIALAGLIGLVGALPVVAGLASSAITVGLGGALAMMAIKAAASAKDVQDAFQDLRDDLRDGLRDAAAPFEGSLVRMIGVAREQLAGLAPFIGRAFARLAPAVESAFGSVMRTVGDLGPIIDNIAAKSAPLIQVFGREMSGLVRSLAGDFQQLAAAADPAPRSWTWSAWTGPPSPPATSATRSWRSPPGRGTPPRPSRRPSRRSPNTSTRACESSTRRPACGRPSSLCAHRWRRPRAAWRATPTPP